MARLGLPGGLSEARRKELWERWKAGESISDISRALKKPPGSIHGILKAQGGIAPPPMRRSRLALIPAEREEISRGLAAGESLRAIAARLSRPLSTVSREVGRNGGRQGYRATVAEERARRRARRTRQQEQRRHEEQGIAAPGGRDRIQDRLGAPQPPAQHGGQGAEPD